MAKEPYVSLGKTIETQEIQGTLEGSRVFLGMGPHCMLGIVGAHEGARSSACSRVPPALLAEVA